MLSTQTVVQTDSETRIMVKSRYLPSRGTASEVGGIISARSRKNTVNETSIEIHNVTCQRNVYTVSLSRSLSRFQFLLLSRRCHDAVASRVENNGTTTTETTQQQQQHKNTNNISERTNGNRNGYGLSIIANNISISYIYAM